MKRLWDLEIDEHNEAKTRAFCTMTTRKLSIGVTTSGPSFDEDRQLCRQHASEIDV